MSLQARLQDLALSGWRRRAVLAALTVATWGAVVAAGQAPVPRPPELGALALEWPSGRVLSEQGTRILDTPVLPGSVAKVFALAAAAERGLVTAQTSHMCRRVATADGRRFVCSHPDLKRPLSAVEALAYSCNDFFVELARRLPRAALNDVRRRAGLEAIADTTPWASAVVGLAGPSTAPRALLRAVARVAGVGPDAVALPAATRALLRDGMRGAVEYGSANALGRRRADALAKTGTSPMAGGRSLGLVVAFAPASAPTRAAVVVAPGGAGIDAADVAGGLLAATPEATTVQQPVSAIPKPPPATPALPSAEGAQAPAVSAAPRPADHRRGAAPGERRPDAAHRRHRRERPGAGRDDRRRGVRGAGHLRRRAAARRPRPRTKRWPSSSAPSPLPTATAIAPRATTSATPRTAR